MSEVELKRLSKSFGNLTAVDDISLSVRDGELLCLLGPSGCGKSTTMRMISGLETPTSGVVHIGGHDVTENPAYERDTSMVFQDWALFPYKTVQQICLVGRSNELHLLAPWQLILMFSCLMSHSQILTSGFERRCKLN